MIRNSILPVLSLLLISESCGAQEVPHNNLGSDTSVRSVGSGFFEARQNYLKATDDSIKTGDKSKAANAGMQLQRALDISAYDSDENAKIVGSADLALSKSKKTESSTEQALKQFYLLQEIKIAQNKLILRMLTELKNRGELKAP